MLDSQIVEAAEEKVKFFILQDFWPAFKVFQIFGFFPITKVIDENGNISLQPTKIWKSVMIQSIWWLVLILTSIGKLKSRPFDFFVDYSRVHIGSNEVFSKILKINDTSYERAACFH